MNQFLTFCSHVATEHVPILFSTQFNTSCRGRYLVGAIVELILQNISIQLKMASKAVVSEIINTISILVKEELKTILINKCKNRKKRRFWVRQ